jgi:hypothetical protein
MEEGALDAPGHRYSERRREMGHPFGNTFNSRGTPCVSSGKGPEFGRAPAAREAGSHVVSEAGMVLLWTQLVRRDLRGSRTFD